MAFLPSKGNPESPVANRYFGLFKSGKMKARGIAFRRSDTPPLIQKAQLRMLEFYQKQKMWAIMDQDSKILDLLLEYSLILKDGQAKNEDLAIGKRISRSLMLIRWIA